MPVRRPGRERATTGTRRKAARRPRVRGRHGARPLLDAVPSDERRGRSEWLQLPSMSIRRIKEDSRTNDHADSDILSKIVFLSNVNTTRSALASMSNTTMFVDGVGEDEKRKGMGLLLLLWAVVGGLRNARVLDELVRNPHLFLCLFSFTGVYLGGLN